MYSLYTASALEVAAKLRSGELSAEEYAKALLAVAEKGQGRIHAWAYLDPETVLLQARELDKIPVDRRGPLHGLPFGIKDIFLTQDMPTHFNSPLFANAPTVQLDATAIKVLRSAGAVIFGKTETTQFASTTTGGPCANPHNVTHTPGGSSSGSAAAVADLHVPLALGTQTGGSVVRPASFCGIWGFKPTWGTVSTEGMCRYSTTCDTVGYFARSIDDLDLVASVYAQRAYPSPQLREPIPPTAKVAMLRTHVWPKAGPGLQQAWQEARRLLEAQGYHPEALELPAEFANMTEWHADLTAHESRAMFLGHYLADKDQLDKVIVSIFERGATLTPEKVRKMYDGVGHLRSQWDEIAAQYDLIVTPSTTDSAPEGLGWTGDACFNAMWSALHAPSVNVPGLTGSGGLPIGLTVVGPRWTDEHVLRGGATLGRVLNSKGAYGQ